MFGLEFGILRVDDGIWLISVGMTFKVSTNTLMFKVSIGPKIFKVKQNLI